MTRKRPTAPSNLQYRTAEIRADSDGHRYWTCPACGRTLGEVVNGSVVVKVGQRYLIIYLANDQMQRCPVPSCGVDSVLRIDQVAA